MDQRLSLFYVLEENDRLELTDQQLLHFLNDYNCPQHNLYGWINYQNKEKKHIYSVPSVVLQIW